MPVPAAADPRYADGLMVLDAGRFGHLVEDAVHKDMKAVTTGKDALSLDNGRDLLVTLLVRASCLGYGRQAASQ
ncbi:hypothetical protein ACFL5Q_00335 [Planctomycetota bacterium]